MQAKELKEWANAQHDDATIEATTGHGWNGIFVLKAQLSRKSEAQTTISTLEQS